MSESSFTLDKKGVSAILKTQTGELINQYAEKIASEVRAAVGDDVEVIVKPYSLDRQAASVTIADSRGAELQASDGALTRAAAKVGLEVKPK